MLQPAPTPAFVWLTAVQALDFLDQCRLAGVPAPSFQTSPGTTSLCAYLTPAQARALQRRLGSHSSPAMKAITRAFPPAPRAADFLPLSLGHQDHVSTGVSQGPWPATSY